MSDDFGFEDVPSASPTGRRCNSCGRPFEVIGVRGPRCLSCAEGANETLWVYEGRLLLTSHLINQGPQMVSQAVELLDMLMGLEPTEPQNNGLFPTKGTHKCYIHTVSGTSQVWSFYSQGDCKKCTEDCDSRPTRSVVFNPKGEVVYDNRKKPAPWKNPEGSP